MPKAYVKIRDRLQREGKPLKVAQKSAAKIYNAKIRKPGQKPVTRKKHA